VEFGLFQKSEEVVLRNYADLVYRVAVRNTQSLADAEDVFSETFLIYYSKKPEFESEEHRKAWLLRVAINLSRNLYRTQKRQTELDMDLESEDAGFDRIELSTDLAEALKKIRPEYREVICLFYLQELSTREIAEVLGKNESTVRTQLARARSQLKEFM
jgi:RNA polymerase sigma-70 factor, ECF subfamily